MADRTFNIEKGSPGSMNSSTKGCGTSGRPCPSANQDSMDEFMQGINAQSSPVQVHDDSYSLHMPKTGTRVIKRTRVTRTSTDPNDPELQNNTFNMESLNKSHKSHGSSGPDEYNTYQGYHDPSVIQQSIPPMNAKRTAKNYDDKSAPAMIRVERGPPTPKTPCYFPPSPLPDTPFQSSFRRGRLEHHITLDSDNRSFNSMRSSPRSVYSGYTPYSFGMKSGPPAYGRSFDPARVVINPRTDNQSAPGRINASLARSGRENQSAPAAYGRSFDPADISHMDPRLECQTGPGRIETSGLSRSGRSGNVNATVNQRAVNQITPTNASPMSRSARGVCKNRNKTAAAAHGRSFDPADISYMDPRLECQTGPGRIETSSRSRSVRETCANPSCATNLSGGGLSGYDASGGSPIDNSRVLSPRLANTSAKYPAGIPSTSHHVSHAVSPGSPCDASYNTSEGSGPGKSYRASPPAWSPRQAGQFSYSSPSQEASYHTSEGPSSAEKGHGSAFPFSPRQAGYLNDSSGITSDTSCKETSLGGSFNSSDFRTPPRRPYHMQYTMPTQGSSRITPNISGGSSVHPPGHYNSPIPSIKNSIGAVMRPRISNRPPHPSRDYFSLIEQGAVPPTSKKNKIVRQTTSAGSVVSEECEEIYDIPAELENIDNNEGKVGISPINRFDSRYASSDDNSGFNPQNTSSFRNATLPYLNRSGIEPAAPGMPHYVGRGDRTSPRADKSSTMNDSDFRTTFNSPGRGPCVRPNQSYTMNDSDFRTTFDSPGRGPCVRPNQSSTMNDSDFRTTFDSPGRMPCVRGDQSSTINDSDFGPVDSTGNSGKKGPCCCKKKGAKKEPHNLDSASKCEGIGSPCKEKRSHTSNKSGGSGADVKTPDEPVNVFQAGKYDITTEANATHSVTPVMDRESCICKMIGGNISLDLERIEQEEFMQLSQNLSQWQQSRRKVVSMMDSRNDARVGSASCMASCASAKK